MKKLFTAFTSLFTLAVCSFAGPLDGVWINTDPAIRSISKVEINEEQFTWWGNMWWTKNYPQETKYGPLHISLLADSGREKPPIWKNGYVNEDKGFATHVIIVKRVGEQLVLESVTIYKGGSEQANNLQTFTFKKQP